MELRMQLEHRSWFQVVRLHCPVFSQSIHIRHQLPTWVYVEVMEYLALVINAITVHIHVSYPDKGGSLYNQINIWIDRSKRQRIEEEADFAVI